MGLACVLSTAASFPGFLPPHLRHGATCNAPSAHLLRKWLPQAGKGTGGEATNDGAAAVSKRKVVGLQLGAPSLAAECYSEMNTEYLLIVLLYLRYCTRTSTAVASPP